MPGKGTTDVIFIMRNVEEKHHAKKKLYYAFADLEKKLVPREVLRKMGVDELALYPLDKGLKVNAGNTKLMVGISGGKMIVNSGKWPSLHSMYKKLIHRR